VERIAGGAEALAEEIYEQEKQNQDREWKEYGHQPQLRCRFGGQGTASVAFGVVCRALP